MVTIIIIISGMICCKVEIYRITLGINKCIKIYDGIYSQAGTYTIPDDRQTSIVYEKHTRKT